MKLVSPGLASYSPGRLELAVIRLTEPDISLFWTHRARSQRQHLTLEGSVLGPFPGEALGGSLKVSVVLHGPGGRPGMLLTRKIVHRGANGWLGGEPIFDPVEEPGRFDHLAPNDFAVVQFDREAGLVLVLVSPAEDAALHKALAEVVGDQLTVAISPNALESLRSNSVGAYAGPHPFLALLPSDTVEQALFHLPGDGDGRASPLTPQALSAQVMAAEETGLRGGELFGTWLDRQGLDEEEFEWVSQRYARAPYDFLVHRAPWQDGSPRLFVKVRATRGLFDRPIHMSIAELTFAANQPGYRIARVYDVGAQQPGLKLLAGAQEFAIAMIAALDLLPGGVVVDSVQIDVTRHLGVEWEGLLADAGS